jgi:deoxyribodipyrimidine photo-lyase
VNKADLGLDGAVAGSRTVPCEMRPQRAGSLDPAGRVAFARGLASDPAGVPAASGLIGGRSEALRRLAAIDPIEYAQSRNHLRGAVTGLSPWIRHGIVTLAEVRDRAVVMAASPGADAGSAGGTIPARSDRQGAGPHPAAKLVAELGWRDYWRRVHASLGEAIQDDIEPPARQRRGRWIDTMPEEVLAGRTGLACIDAFVEQLCRTGWLHNHSRMWLAAWLVHVRGVRWQAGAAWFLSHLLDGDPASNSLSWQWVAGTFAAKPYLFNRENLERYSDGVFCRGCPLLGRCDLEGSYEELDRRLFEPADGSPGRASARIPPADPWEGSLPPGGAPGPALVWLTLDSLGGVGPAVLATPDAAKVFVVDPSWLAEERPTVKRLVFILECLADLPDTEILIGDPGALLPQYAARIGCRSVAVADTPCPRVRRAAAAIAKQLPLAVHRWPRFADDARIGELGRFSRYWRHAEASAMRPSG